jgi:hypothetical protein
MSTTSDGARVFKWKLSIAWMTPQESLVFKRMRAQGHLSSFRIAYCKGYVSQGDRMVPCASEVPLITDDETGEQIKRYCSKLCYDNATRIEGQK